MALSSEDFQKMGNEQPKLNEIELEQWLEEFSKTKNERIKAIIFIRFNQKIGLNEAVQVASNSPAWTNMKDHPTREEYIEAVNKIPDQKEREMYLSFLGEDKDSE